MSTFLSLSSTSSIKLNLVINSSTMEDLLSTVETREPNITEHSIHPNFLVKIFELL